MHTGSVALLGLLQSAFVDTFCKAPDAWLLGGDSRVEEDVEGELDVMLEIGTKSKLLRSRIFGLGRYWIIILDCLREDSRILGTENSTHSPSILVIYVDLPRFSCPEQGTFTPLDSPDLLVVFLPHDASVCLRHFHPHGRESGP